MNNPHRTSYGSYHDSYLEGKVLGADGLELVRILYRLAIESVEDASSALKTGDAAARAGSISRVQSALTELIASLDQQRGGELSRNLGNLYAYMHGRLCEAHIERQREPLEEVASLLRTLYAGWESCTPDSAASQLQ
ncbi:MAG: flagellar export chaperone FliS [Bryobacteraceae bacterium]